jgi:tetratricopeptide (TPR) repeat protein
VTRRFSTSPRRVCAGALSLALLTAGPLQAQQPVIPKPPEAETLLQQAVELHQAGDILGAIANYEAYLKVEPGNPGVRSNLGAALVRLGRYEEGIAEYRKALAAEPQNADFRFNLGLALYKAGQAADASRELEAVLAAKQDHRSARLVLGDCYLRMGRFQDVVDLLAPWDAQYADDLAFAYMLGHALVETNRPEEGQRLIDRIFRAGDSAEGHLLLGSAHLRSGDTPEALVELRKAIALNPDLPLVNGLLGRALMRNGEQDAALRAFRRELEINPNDFGANLEVGEIKKREQQFDDAQIYVKRALAMRPNDVSARFSLAGIYVSTGKTDEARQILEQVVKDAPKYSEAYVLLATVYYRLQRRQDGDRMRAIVEQLNAEAQARQPGVK